MKIKGVMDSLNKMRKIEAGRSAADNKRLGEMAAGVIAQAVRFGKPSVTVRALCS